MKKLILLSILLSGINIYSQNINNVIANDEDFLKFKNKSLEFYQSEDFQKEINLGFIFRKKLGESIATYDTKNFGDWLSKNLSSTKFESVDEGMKLYNDLETLKKSSSKIKTEFAKTFNKFSDKYGHDEFSLFYKENIKDKIF